MTLPSIPGSRLRSIPTRDERCSGGPLVTFRDFEPEDCVEISRGLTAELLRLGLTEDPASIAEGRALKAAGPCWTAVGRSGEILCCGGIHEQFAGVQGIAWAMFAPAIGAAHLAITRFAAWQIRTSPLFRVEVLVARRSQPMRWARLLGFRHAIEIGPWGPDREDTVMFARFRASPSREVAALPGAKPVPTFAGEQR